ncbi:hypothetical protein GQX73_g1483 [Xylaria multiplex]|uniref:Uncharacterized protein n=1 Tax=Xylaria multiplex TaxID=323545 RepID=A0A7C8MZN3_9PEZI|nr:hypothetical protein GQX73_g1483 [Xylaria multiplex]
MGAFDWWSPVEQADPRQTLYDSYVASRLNYLTSYYFTAVVVIVRSQSVLFLSFRVTSACFNARQASARITPPALYATYKSLTKHTHPPINSLIEYTFTTAMSASKASAISHAKDSTKSVLMQPLENANSYFPKGATALTPASTLAADTTETPLSSDSSALGNPLSPLDRDYTKPLHDVDIASQLTKQPTYWSVQGWVQRSASSSSQPASEDPEAKARKFEEAKKDLLASVGRF